MLLCSFESMFAGKRGPARETGIPGKWTYSQGRARVGERFEISGFPKIAPSRNAYKSMKKNVNSKIAQKRKTRSHLREMSTRTYIQTPVPEDLKKRFYDACEKVAMNGAGVGRKLFEAFVEQIENGERVTPPYRIEEKEEKNRKLKL